eukprot:6020234-Pyramimonas_sp.AAC.2
MAVMLVGVFLYKANKGELRFPSFNRWQRSGPEDTMENGRSDKRPSTPIVAWANQGNREGPGPSTDAGVGVEVLTPTQI